MSGGGQVHSGAITSTCQKASGLPMAASNGSTVTASAPPTPAAKQATVVRSMFTQGSRRVSIAGDVTAC